MKKYKLLTQDGYDKDEGLTKGGIYNEDFIDTIGSTVAELVVNFPEDWEEVTDDKAMRFNSDKAKLSLISLEELEPMAKVLEFGAKKYARDNWKKGLKFSEILDSMMRHIAKLQSGEYYDKESGLSHIGHIQCNALFLGGNNNEIDLEFKDKCCGDWDEKGQCKCKPND